MNQRAPVEWDERVLIIDDHGYIEVKEEAPYYHALPEYEYLGPFEIGDILYHRFYFNSPAPA